MGDNEPTPVERLAERVEVERVDRAEQVETDRVEAAADIEAERVALAVVEALNRDDLAAALEADNARHNAHLEERLREQFRRINRRLAFLFSLLLVAFLLLAYRSEVNGRTVADGLYEACANRVATATTYNQGREALITLVVNTPVDPPRTDAQKTDLAQRLREGLLLPIEDCGPRP